MLEKRDNFIVVIVLSAINGRTIHAISAACFYHSCSLQAVFINDISFVNYPVP